MTRAQLTTLLAYAVQHDWITADEARTIIQRFDAGDVDASQLPLPVAEALGNGLPSEREYVEALLALLGVTGAVLRGGLGQSGRKTREALRERLQDRYMEQARRLAEQAAVNAQQWHTAMRDLLTTYLTGMTVLGRGTTDFPSGELRLTLRIQLMFLHQFVSQVALQAQTNHALTVAQIAARSELYAGAGRELWFRSNEVGSTAGYIVRYIAVDDANTCPKCVIAEQQGPYMAGLGPFPGAVCYGKGRCRCRRELEYSPSEYQHLVDDNQRRASVLAGNV